MNANKALLTVKIAHTVIWAFFVSCILAIPFFTYQNNFLVSGILIFLLTLEAAVVIINHWSCPLTNIAARYTEDRNANFDIFLPVWLAKYNKLIFGTLFILALIYTALQWLIAV